MKTPFFRFCAIVLAALLLPLAALLLSAFALPVQYGDTFLGEMPDKLRLLEETPGKRIVVVGGSSVPFSLDSALLEAQLPDYSVVDFGMYADMGTLVMLDWARAEVHEGDLFVVAPEQSAQSLSCYLNGEDVWQASDGAFGQLSLLPAGRWERLLAGFPAFAGKKLGCFLTGAPSVGGIYSKAAFNEYGDVDCPGREGNVLSLGYDPNQLISFSPDVVSEEFLDELNGFARDVAARGGKVLYHFSPMNAAALAPGTKREDVDAYYDELQDRLLFPILGDPNRCILDSGWFYDTNFHLNASGATVFTKLLAEDIKVYLGDASPTDIALPAMPPPAVSRLEGDDSDADLFTYRREGDGWVASGLTPEGRAAAELTVPASFEGAPVVAVDPALFIGNTSLTRIVIQPNAGALYDGMFAGCTALREVVLTGEDPSAYAVGDGLMDGARFVIRVPDSAVDAYRRHYSWQAYESYLIPISG